MLADFKTLLKTLDKANQTINDLTDIVAGQKDEINDLQTDQSELREMIKRLANMLQQQENIQLEIKKYQQLISEKPAFLTH